MPDLPHSGVAADTGGNRFLLAILWLFSAVLAGLLLWAIFSPIEIRVVAPGEVADDAQIVEIKAVTSSVVRQLHARNGQSVQAGQILVSLEDGKLREQRRLTAAKIEKLQCRIKNAQAELELLSRHEADIRNAVAIDSFPEKTPLRDYQPVCRLESNIYRMRALLEALELNFERAANAKERIKGLDEQIALARRQLRSVEQDRDTARTLVEKRLSSESQLRQSDRAVDERQLALVNLMSDLEGQQGALAEVRKQTYLGLSEHIGKLARPLDADRLALDDEKLALQNIELALEMRTIRSPVDGTVVDVNNFIVANFAQQSEILLKLMPESQLRLIKAHVSIGDIDNVQRRGTALVRFPTNATLRDELFDAQIQIINPITSDGRPGNAESFYEVVLQRVDRGYDPDENRVYSGTPVEIMFAAERTTVARALTHPVVRNWPRIFEQ